MGDELPSAVALAPLGPDSDPMPTPGGQTGDDSGLLGLQCDLVTPRPIALDEPSSLGFVPNEAIALALGSRALPLHWLSPVFDTDGQLLDYAARASSEVQLSVELAGTQARQLERTDSTYGVRCDDVIEVDVSGRLTSADGALAEPFEASLRLFAGLASLELSLPVATLRGSLSFDPPELRGLPPTGLSVHVVFTRYGQSGQITQHYGDGASSARLSLADWPRETSCGSIGITPVLNPLTPSVEDVIRAVRGNHAWTLVNAAGESAPLELGLTATPEAACFSPGLFARHGQNSDGVDELVVPGELTLDSTGLPAPIRLPLDVVGHFGAASAGVEHALFGRRSTPCTTGGYYSPSDFVTHCGDWGIDSSEYTAVSIEVRESSFGPSGSYAVFSLRGDRYPGCSPSPDGYVCSETDAGDLEVENIGEVRIFVQ